MKPIKVSEASGAVLDWMVAKCEFVGAPPINYYGGNCWTIEGEAYEPSTDWAQGGPIIEREGGTLWSTTAPGWRCKAKYDTENDREGTTQGGPTMLIAAMRCYVASKLGEEVEVPDEIA